MPKRTKPAVPAEADTSKIARQSIGKMAREEIREINSLIRRCMDEQNFPKFRAGLLKLGYDENSEAYARLVGLWDEYVRSLRHS